MASNSYLKELIYTSDFPGRAIPVIYLADGKPGFSINQWIYWLVGGGIILPMGYCGLKGTGISCV